MKLGEAFTIRLRELLKRDKISLHKFLKDNCIPRSTIVNIEKGNTKSPTLAIIYQVAKGFNMTHIEFLSHPAFFDEDVEYM
ncbi:MAG: helix-turn-helix transcriptional regulator [Clostridia bacterium]|nr:helix-turn-helix transcriptional regulator [Clostridia bacterium]